MGFEATPRLFGKIMTAHEYPALVYPQSHGELRVIQCKGGVGLREGSGEVRVRGREAGGEAGRQAGRWREGGRI